MIRYHETNNYISTPNFILPVIKLNMIAAGVGGVTRPSRRLHTSYVITCPLTPPLFSIIFIEINFILLVYMYQRKPTTNEKENIVKG